MPAGMRPWPHWRPSALAFDWLGVRIGLLHYQKFRIDRVSKALREIRKLFAANARAVLENMVDDDREPLRIKALRLVIDSLPMRDGP
jgi:hypothetical protein